IFWPALDPIGRTFNSGKEVFHVIGLAKEVSLPTLEANLDLPGFYSPFTSGGSQFMARIRCGGACPSIPAIRRTIGGVHAALQVNSVGRLEDVYTEQLARPRAAASVGSIFAVIAVLTAAGGLLSVLSYAVAR